MYMYHAVAYTGGFHAAIAGVPLAIVLGWAALLYGVLEFTDNVAIKNKPLLDGLILVGVDIVLDPLAVRAGLWSWNLSAGFLGIPYENFFAWLLFGILVSYTARALWHNRKSLLQPIVATAEIHAIGVPLGFAWFTYSGRYQSMLFWTLVAAAVVVVALGYFRREYLK